MLVPTISCDPMSCSCPGGTQDAHTNDRCTRWDHLCLCYCSCPSAVL